MLLHQKKSEIEEKRKEQLRIQQEMKQAEEEKMNLE